MNVDLSNVKVGDWVVVDVGSSRYPDERLYKVGKASPKLIEVSGNRYKRETGYSATRYHRAKLLRKATDAEIGEYLRQQRERREIEEQEARAKAEKHSMPQWPLFCTIMGIVDLGDRDRFLKLTPEQLRTILEWLGEPVPEPVNGGERTAV